MLLWKQDLNDISIRSLFLPHVFCQYKFLYNSVELCQYEIGIRGKKAGLVPNLNVKLPCNGQHLTLHCQFELCVTYCAKRKDKGKIMINVIVATYLLIVNRQRKTVTTYWPLTLIFNKAIKKNKNLCVQNFCLSLLLKYFFFFNMGVQMHFCLPISSIKYVFYYY